MEWKEKRALGIDLGGTDRSCFVYRKNNCIIGIWYDKKPNKLQLLLAEFRAWTITLGEK